MLGEHKKKLILVDTILSTTKLIIYTNRNNVANVNIRQIRYSLKDLFLIETYWAETNDKIPKVTTFTVIKMTEGIQVSIKHTVLIIANQ